MVFSSFVFLFAFLPLVLLLYFCSPDKAKNAVLLAFSLLFYAWGEPLWIGVLLLNVAVGWAGGLLIERGRGHRMAKIALIASLVFQVGVLVYFKYTGFLVQTLQPVIPFPVSFRDPGLPIGISFFTFHLISYLVDVYRGDAPALRSYTKLLLYISLFPQLVAGPIIRYADVQEQLSRRRITLEGFSSGIARFVVGLGKKVVLANTLADISTVFLDGDLSKLSLLGAWLGIVLFALQIYFDFSGYSDMAIGLGRMFGFHFKENFNYPYVSRSASEFWRRWNISVGRFFRDYVYIPLGGNRRNPAFNLFAVWFLTGLWHGASWNYVLWGVYFGVLIAIERSFLFRILSLIPAFASHIYFLVIVLIGWVFFYFESIGRGLMYLRVMLGFTSAPLASAELAIHLQNHLFLLPVAVIAATPLPAVLHLRLAALIRPGFARSLYANTLVPFACLAILTVSALLLVGKTYSPFFYFRF
ncbi:MBOAT family O-acyltransferase [Paenibacillus elgii]